MSRKKMAEILLAAVSSLITAAKSLIRFIGCIIKMKPAPAGS